MHANLSVRMYNARKLQKFINKANPKLVCVQEGSETPGFGLNVYTHYGFIHSSFIYSPTKQIMKY